MRSASFRSSGSAVTPHRGPIRPRERLAGRRAAMNTHTIGKVLKRLRAQRSLSQLALGKRSGVAQAQISRIEANKQKNPHLDTLAKLARALGVPVRELLE